ncbi:MAG: hypothetical protein M1531_02030 [Chloroflexi bacterium]|nr:hypothetical protein [Chloroflexota bacterium]
MRLSRPRIFYGWWMVIGGAVALAIHGGAIHYGFSAYFNPLIDEFH